MSGGTRYGGLENPNRSCTGIPRTRDAREKRADRREVRGWGRSSIAAMTKGRCRREAQRADAPDKRWPVQAPITGPASGRSPD